MVAAMRALALASESRAGQPRELVPDASQATGRKVKGIPRSHLPLCLKPPAPSLPQTASSLSNLGYHLLRLTRAAWKHLFDQSPRPCLSRPPCLLCLIIRFLNISTRNLDRLVAEHTRRTAACHGDEQGEGSVPRVCRSKAR